MFEWTFDWLDKTECCGCEACRQACPVGCIEMAEDEESFLYPSFDKEKCVECGRCREVCPVRAVGSDRGAF